MPVRLVAVAAARKIYAATTIFPLKIERRWQNCGVNALQKRSNALPVAAAAAAAQKFCAATNFPLKMNGSSTIWLQLCCNWQTAGGIMSFYNSIRRKTGDHTGSPLQRNRSEK